MAPGTPRAVIWIFSSSFCPKRPSGRFGVTSISATRYSNYSDAKSIWSCPGQFAIRTFSRPSISSVRCSMPHKAPTLLEDVRHWASLIQKFTAGQSLLAYSRDDMLRSAVERGFIIIGEALGRLEKLDATL